MKCNHDMPDYKKKNTMHLKPVSLHEQDVAGLPWSID